MPDHLKIDPEKEPLTSPKAEALRAKIAEAVAKAVLADPKIVQLQPPNRIGAFGSHLGTIRVGDRKWDLTAELNGGLSLDTDRTHPTEGPIPKQTWHIHTALIHCAIVDALEELCNTPEFNLPIQK